MSKNKGTTLPYSISQNFLTQRKLIERLIRMAGLTKEDTVLEIGAGKGHITRALAKQCGRVIAYEIDPALCARLRGNLPPNVSLREGDFLKAALPREPYCVFANIPFSVTTDIIRKLSTTPDPPRGMWLVMEKGAAMRFLGKGRENLSSLLLKPCFDSRIVWHFRREDFHPSPRVECVMAEFRRKELPDIPPAQAAEYARFIRHSLAYGLTGRRGLLTAKQVSAALKKEGLPALAPSGEIAYIQWLCLFRCWLKYGKR